VEETERAPKLSSNKASKYRLFPELDPNDSGNNSQARHHLSFSTIFAHGLMHSFARLSSNIFITFKSTITGKRATLL
jgi:hypothetical protein